MDHLPQPTLPGFTVHTLRGRGATSTVYSARRDLDGWICAIKVFSDGSDAQDAAVREVTALSGVRVTGLIRMHDVMTTEDGRTALVLDLVEGGSLREIIKDRGKLTLREALGVARTVLSVLASVHARDVVHADLSPSNILVSADGRAVVGDLGSSRFLGETECPSTISGTRGFIAPELLMGGSPSTASDIYAFGASMWTMLTGQLPGGLLEEPEDIPECPIAMRDLLRDCLATEPGRRPTAREAQSLCEMLGPDEPLSLPDGPDLGGRLTHRLHWQAEEVKDLPSAVLAASSSITERVVADRSVTKAEGRHRDGQDPHPVIVFVSACVRVLLSAPSRIAVSAVLGVCAGLGLWWGISRPEIVETVSIERAAAENQEKRPTAPTASVSPTSSPRTAPSVEKSNSAPTPGRSSRSLAVVPNSTDVDPTTAPKESVPETSRVLSEVLNARAAAYASAELPALADCYVPDSPEYETATSDVERLRRAGLRYRGLGYVVREVSPAPPSGKDDQRMTVHATVDTKPYRIVSQIGDGNGVEVPAEQGVHLSYQLQRTPAGWRLFGIGQ